jgi:hypothetical protein
LKPTRVLSTEVIFNHRVTDNHIAKEYLLIPGWRGAASADTNNQRKLDPPVADSQAGGNACCIAFSHSWHVAQHHIMHANPSIYICIRVAPLFAIVFAQSVIMFIKKGFDSFRLKGKGTDNRDRKIGAAFRSHFGNKQRGLSED